MPSVPDTRGQWITLLRRPTLIPSGLAHHRHSITTFYADVSQEMDLERKAGAKSPGQKVWILFKEQRGSVLKHKQMLH